MLSHPPYFKVKFLSNHLILYTRDNTLCVNNQKGHSQNPTLLQRFRFIVHYTIVISVFIPFNRKSNLSFKLLFLLGFTFFHQNLQNTSPLFIILCGVIALYGFLFAKLLPIPLCKNLLRFHFVRTTSSSYTKNCHYF